MLVDNTDEFHFVEVEVTMSIRFNYYKRVILRAIH